jgi:mannose-6-phosphate isomerase-like protein (cupin superfamily)
VLNQICRRIRVSTAVPTVFAILLALGWTAREVAFARMRADVVRSSTVTLDQVKMNEYKYEGQPCGTIGLYVQGDTPGSSKFVTGRFVLDAGKSPHPPHVHEEEEVMVVESGQGEIFCDGKTTKVGPGSVMYTTPKAPHSIVNTGKEPIVFYFIKWAGKPSS